MKKIRLLWDFMKGYRLMYIGAIFSVCFATLFTLLNPLVLRTTIDSIIGDKPLDLPNWATNIVEFLGGTNELSQKLWICALIIIALTILRGLFLYLKGKWSAVSAESTARNMREKLYDHLQHLNYDYHVKAETGDLIQRCTSDLDTIRRFLAVQSVEIGRAIFIVSLISPIIFSLNTKLALVALIVIPFIFVFAIVFFMKIKASFKLSDEAEGKMSAVLQENLTGMRVVRAFARQKFEIEKFDEKSKEYRDLTYKVVWLLAWYWALSDLLCMLQIGAVLILGTYWAATGVITLGTLVVFITYEGMILWPVRQLGRILTDLGKTLVSLERIKEILDEPIEKIEANESTPEIKGDIRFKDVYFEYDKDRPVLKNISFNVKQGETIAVMGQTGSGKSSLIHLLARLYNYKEGSIKIDGVELKNIQKKWIRKNVGIVLQEPFLFSKTIKDNIGLARKEAKEAEIFEAARVAAIHDVILNFENGYETSVGERGVTLSGGQKQRIAIARTIINDTPILVFDDSLSAVDTETDAYIRKALNSRKNNATTFIISHRVSTLAEADKIIVLDKGELIQMGTHEELIKQPGLYSRVWKIQNSLEQDMDKIG
ncbi:ABC transporter ATP-binding protein [Sporosalibacterium faouarense]|uniref:ABC transporter ATP-binding protein n=1 Tax=Sporosalibacterium faouarense TaxID=516123 RepID=UPI00141C730E|nr:ABC transporter ATP-binding protein [Sporosalibacterium faouarense]MTI48690.1 ABC transporter ATP-binding protein [Bacillota bacterium]